ncbi:hypothetical protein PDN41_20220 [Bacillus cereus]|nr:MULTISPECIES: hypothetical protein [Bacillus cereus group]MDA2384041.1 hypothetical protein [Bacillus cereus]MEB9683010.1 hypothetical protein [Bacillus anthracis]
MVRMHDRPTASSWECGRIPDGTGLYREHIERYADTISVATVDE